MAQALRNRRWYRYLSHFCRIAFALTFIVSGFFKAIDPWGSILNLRSYMMAYDITAPDWLVFAVAVWLSGAELMMGNMLLFKVRIRFVSILALISMTFFTILTLLSATIIPVEDCGCFGEFIKLTPWQSFAKNAVLLPMAVCFWYRYRPDKAFAFSKLEFSLMCLFFTAAMGLGIYSYYHLPMIDLLPYKQGVNIPEEMDRAREVQAAENVVLVYRNRRTGRIREFSLDDKAWHNENQWEWVETRVESDHNGVEHMILEFYISDAEGDKSAEILSTPNLYMLFMAKDVKGKRVRERFAAVEQYVESNGGSLIYVTPNDLSTISTTYPLYNMDYKTMKTILRADYGLVELDRGVVRKKYNYLDIPY